MGWTWKEKREWCCFIAFFSPYKVGESGKQRERERERLRREKVSLRVTLHEEAIIHSDTKWRSCHSFPSSSSFVLSFSSLSFLPFFFSFSSSPSFHFLPTFLLIKWSPTNYPAFPSIHLNILFLSLSLFLLPFLFLSLSTSISFRRTWRKRRWQPHNHLLLFLHLISI